MCYDGDEPLKPIYGLHGAREVVNPISEFTYTFMKNVLKEIKETFRDPYLHMGMDEGMLFL